jgi:hypothetical protein
MGLLALWATYFSLFHARGILRFLRSLVTVH